MNALSSGWRTLMATFALVPQVLGQGDRGDATLAELMLETVLIGAGRL